MHTVPLMDSPGSTPLSSCDTDADDDTNTDTLIPAVTPVPTPLLHLARFYNPLGSSKGVNYVRGNDRYI